MVLPSRLIPASRIERHTNAEQTEPTVPSAQSLGTTAAEYSTSAGWL